MLLERFSYGSKIPTAFLRLVSELWLIYEYRVTVFTLLGTLGLVLTQPSDFTEEVGSGPRNGRPPREAEWSGVRRHPSSPNIKRKACSGVVKDVGMG